MTDTTGNEPTRMLGDRYAIGEVIGRGGMAEVHEGKDLRLGRRVAIKILRPDLAKDPSFQARFRREAQSAAALNHPNIVAVYDTGEDTLATDVDGRPVENVVVPYIVMEYVDGMTLRQVLHSGRRLMPERALEITAGILAALDYAHRHGIVHRDIKPANVMLTRAGDVKVMDFGIARALGDSGQTMTSASAVMGTAQYLSPEQARGEVVDARSDLYSTGVLLYELLTGRPPFTGDSAVSIAYQHVSENPVPPSQVDPGVSPEIDAIVMRALAKHPDDRYQTAGEFRADIERAIAGAPVTATMPVAGAAAVAATQKLTPVDPEYDPIYDQRRPRRKSRAGMWVVGIVGLIVAAIAAFFLISYVFGGSGTSKVAVPNLDGLTIEQATTELTAANLRLGTQTPEVSDRPEGTIIAQQPAADEQIQTGQAVNVTVSGGKEKATVPQLVGLASIDAARTALTDAKLQLGSIKQKNSPQPEGYVLAQDPAEATQVDTGSMINITVSTGQVKVPDVVGMSEAQAKAEIVNAGFQVQTIEQESDSYTAGTVLAQSPQSGAAPKGTVVTITIATAPPRPTPTPTPTPTSQSPTPQPTDTALPSP